MVMHVFVLLFLFFFLSAMALFMLGNLLAAVDD